MKTLQHKIKTPPSTAVLLVASGLLLLSFITYHFVYQRYKARQEKQQFEAASSELRQIAKEIQTKVGTADQVKEEKSCSYANRKFSQGPLSCSIYISLLYLDKDNIEASAIMQKVSNFKGSSGLTLLGTRRDSFMSMQEYKSQQIVNQSLSIGLPLDECLIKYTYPVISGEGAPFDVDNEGIVISLVCGGSSSYLHYKTAES